MKYVIIVLNQHHFICPIPLKSLCFFCCPYFRILSSLLVSFCLSLSFSFASAFSSTFPPPPHTHSLAVTEGGMKRKDDMINGKRRQKSALFQCVKIVYLPPQVKKRLARNIKRGALLIWGKEGRKMLRDEFVESTSILSLVNVGKLQQ